MGGGLVMQPFQARAFTICKRLVKGARMVEVGVLRGQTTGAILSSRRDVHVTMVDSWATTDKQPERYRATGDDHALHKDPARVRSHFNDAKKNTALFRERRTILCMNSVEAAAVHHDRTFDLVFIDADHSYEGVREDIAAWLPKIRTGGWIGGHDYANPDPRFKFGVTDAVDDWCRETGSIIETDLNFTWWARV